MRVPFGEWDSVKAQLSNVVDDPTKNHIRKDTHTEDPLNFSTVDWNPEDPAVPGYVNHRDSSSCRILNKFSFQVHESWVYGRSSNG